MRIPVNLVIIIMQPVNENIDGNVQIVLIKCIELILCLFVFFLWNLYMTFLHLCKWGASILSAVDYNTISESRFADLEVPMCNKSMNLLWLLWLMMELLVEIVWDYRYCGIATSPYMHLPAEQCDPTRPSPSSRYQFITLSDRTDPFSTTRKMEINQGPAFFSNSKEWNGWIGHSRLEIVYYPLPSNKSSGTKASDENWISANKQTKANYGRFCWSCGCFNLPSTWIFLIWIESRTIKCDVTE